VVRIFTYIVEVLHTTLVPVSVSTPTMIMMMLIITLTNSVTYLHVQAIKEILTQDSILWPSAQDPGMLTS
jgi:hypothetical protein